MLPGSGRLWPAPRRGLYELMVQLAAYTGLRWGELAALAQRPPGAQPQGELPGPRRGDIRPVLWTGRRPCQSACLSIVVWPWQRTSAAFRLCYS
jgi:hypothetical protein